MKVYAQFRKGFVYVLTDAIQDRCIILSISCTMTDLQTRSMHDLIINNQFMTIVIKDENTNAATAIVESGT